MVWDALWSDSHQLSEKGTRRSRGRPRSLVTLGKGHLLSSPFTKLMIPLSIRLRFYRELTGTDKSIHREFGLVRCGRAWNPSAQKMEAAESGIQGLP